MLPRGGRRSERENEFLDRALEAIALASTLTARRNGGPPLPGRGEALKKRPYEPAQALRLDTGDAALADFEDAMLAGNEVEIDVSDGLAIDAHGALPDQPPRLVGRSSKAELL